MPANIAIGFDFDHTLGIDNQLERTTALDMLATFAKSRDIRYDGAAAEATIDGVLASYRSGDLTVESAIAGFFERFAPSGAAVMDLAQDFRDTVVERAPQYVTALPGARELLEELDALGIGYAMLTNGWSPLQEEKARLISFRGPVFVSERINARKPSREAYDMLAKHFELPLERVWYVGDEPAVDVADTATFGVTPVWFDWEGRPYPKDVPRPAHVIHALSELPALLQGRLTGAANPRG